MIVLVPAASVAAGDAADVFSAVMADLVERRGRGFDVGDSPFHEARARDRALERVPGILAGLGLVSPVPRRVYASLVAAALAAELPGAVPTGEH